MGKVKDSITPGALLGHSWGILLNSTMKVSYLIFKVKKNMRKFPARGRGWEKWRIPSLLGHSWGTPGAPGDPKFDFDFEGRLLDFQNQKKIALVSCKRERLGKVGFFITLEDCPGWAKWPR